MDKLEQQENAKWEKFSKGSKDSKMIHLFYRKPLDPDNIPRDYLALFSLLMSGLGYLLEVNKLNGVYCSIYFYTISKE